MVAPQEIENLKIYRERRLSKGKRVIRKSRYFYQPNDLVKYNHQIYTVKGTHNNGIIAILKESGKSIKVIDLVPYGFSKGFYFKRPSGDKYKQFLPNLHPVEVEVSLLITYELTNHRR